MNLKGLFIYSLLFLIVFIIIVFFCYLIIINTNKIEDAICDKYNNQSLNLKNTTYITINNETLSLNYIQEICLEKQKRNLLN